MAHADSMTETYLIRISSDDLAKLSVKLQDKDHAGLPQHPPNDLQMLWNGAARAISNARPLVEEQTIYREQLE